MITTMNCDYVDVDDEDASWLCSMNRTTTTTDKTITMMMFTDDIMFFGVRW